MNESEQAQEMAEKLQTAITELMKQRSDWSEQMAISCIMQAIKCGDFTRLVHGDKEAYIYLPFQKANELERVVDSQAQKVAELERENLYLKRQADIHNNLMADGAKCILGDKVTIAEQAKEIERLKQRIAGLHAHIDESQAVK